MRYDHTETTNKKHRPRKQMPVANIKACLMSLKYNKLNDLDRKIKQTPSVELYLKRCVVYQQQGRYHDALNDCYSALELDPDNSEAKAHAEMIESIFGYFYTDGLNP